MNKNTSHPSARPDGAAGIPRAELTRLAAQVGAHRYTNRHLPGEPAHAFSIEQLEHFVALVVAAAGVKQGVRAVPVIPADVLNMVDRPAGATGEA